MPSDSSVAVESQTPQLSQSQGAGEEALASPSSDQVFFLSVQQSKEQADQDQWCKYNAYVCCIVHGCVKSP